LKLYGNTIGVDLENYITNKKSIRRHQMEKNQVNSQGVCSNITPNNNYKLTNQSIPPRIRVCQLGLAQDYSITVKFVH
jgi:hypothetical protein